MKVKIITRHAIPNYGSILQAYATQQMFKNIGIDSEIIDYIPISETEGKILETYIKNSNFWNKNYITKTIYKIIQYKNITIMNKKFKEYRKRLLKMSIKEYHTSEELKKYVNKTDYYCTGSDQVWGKIGDLNIDGAYFLDFVKDNSKKISYGASFGKIVTDKVLIKKYYQYINKYKTVLVREKSAKDFLDNIGIKNSNQVLDPTLMVDQKVWKNIAIKPKIKNYILVYQLHHNKKFDKYIKFLKKNTDKKIIRINPSKYFRLKPGKFIYLPTPEEFIGYIENSDLVITDSFHGTCFSIIMNKKFIDILPNETKTRIESILEVFGLSNRIIKDFKDLEIINNKIDYIKINKILKKEVEKSLKLLEEIKNEDTKI